MELTEQNRHNGNEGNPLILAHLSLLLKILALCNGNILILTWLAKCPAGCNQTDKKAAQKDDAIRPDFGNSDRHAVFRHIVGNDSHEDQTVADRNGRIHGDQAKLSRARRLTAIHLHVVHGAEQRWEQDWDIGDMDGDDGAGNAANDCKACKHDPLTVFDQTHDLFCKQGSKSGIGERRGKCAEQKVSQGVFTVFVQAPDDIAEYF